MEQGLKLGNWSCVQILGQGKFGIVAQWLNPLTSEKIAIKQFVKGLNWSNEDVLDLEKRWRTEVDLMCNQIESPFIVTARPIPALLQEYFASSRLPILSLEYCHGGDLRQILRKPEHAAGLPEPEVRKVLACLGGAIAYLHSINIIHRDLKPENILLTQPNENGVYKLGDLGLAKDLAHPDSLCCTLVGTAQYLAPEVFEGSMYDKSVDFWSFGIIAFEICCGLRPFLHGRNPQEWIPLVKVKGKEVISILDGADGKRLPFSSLPYNHHLSERFKQCLEMWLKMMLQFDPKRRGKRISVSPGGDAGEIVAFQVLKTILEMEMLDIYCPMKRVSCAIGRSTTINDVRGWIERDIGTPRDAQLIIRSDGQLALPTHLASSTKKFQPLFMIPKDMEFTVKLPSFLANNFQNWEGIDDPPLLRRIWSKLIHFVVTNVNQLNKLLQANNALRTYNEERLKSDLQTKQDSCQCQIQTYGILKSFDEKLTAIDNCFVLPPTMTLNESDMQLNRDYVTICEQYDTIKEQLNKLSKRSENDNPSKIVALANVRFHIFDLFERWRGSTDKTIVTILVDTLKRFIERCDLISKSFFDQLSYEISRVDEITQLISEFNTLVTNVNEMTQNLVDQRCDQHRQLLTLLYQDKALANTLISNADRYSSSADEEADIKSLIEESISLDSEVESRITNALKEVEGVNGTQARLNWDFLDESD